MTRLRPNGGVGEIYLAIIYKSFLYRMRRLDTTTMHPVGEIVPVLHLHGSRRSMISTAELPQRIALGGNALFFSVREARGNIWRATIKGR